MQFGPSVICPVTLLAAAWITGCQAPTNSQPAGGLKPDAQEIVINDETMFVGTDGITVVDEPMPGARLKVYAADPITLLKSRCVQGAGLDVVIEGRDHKILWHEWVGEADYPLIIDYTNSDSGTIRVKTCTFDPRPQAQYEDDVVPLSEMEVRLKTDRIEASVPKLVLAPEPYDAGRVSALVEAANRAFKKVDDEDLEEALGHLRNIAIAHPREIWQAFKGLDPGNNAHGSEILSDYSTELGYIAELLGQSLPEK